MSHSMFVLGNPAPKGSKRHVGRGILVESSKAEGPWREAVVAQAIRSGLNGLALDGCLTATFRFYQRRPKSHYRSGKYSQLLREDAPDRPIGPPDLSKLVRSVEDALVQANVIVDDARIAEYGHGTGKYYCDFATQSPGAYIAIDVIPDDAWSSAHIPTEEF